MALSGLRSRWRRDETWMPPHPTRQGNAWSDNSTTLEPCIVVFRNRPLPRPWVVSDCSAPNCDARIFSEKDALWLVCSASLRTNRMMHQWRLLRRDAVQGRISASFLLLLAVQNTGYLQQYVGFGSEPMAGHSPYARESIMRYGTR